MIEIVYKLAKVVHSSMLPLLALTIFDSQQNIVRKEKNLDNKKDEVPGDNFPYVAIFRNFCTERT